tara:strand:+ start:4883 stop:6388 length:1506 start_codon:yes stop_codon:yes gene_type:complete
MGLFNRLFILILIIGVIFPISNLDSCIPNINNREISRNNFTYPQTIESDHFVIHFTTSNVDSQLVNGQWYNLQSNYGYAQSIINHAESALSIYLQGGWESPPPDCDESIIDLDSPLHCINFGGNSLYDIYIANDAVGMVVPESSYPVEPYLGGFTSYMKISTLLNEYDTLPYWSEHVVAHELHHSIQLRYGYSVSGTPGNYMYNGWLFEQTATYMENVIYPNSMHLRLMLSNCDVVTPLTYPNYSIDYPSEIYPYRSALWQKFLVESLGDSSIIRYIWEDYGLDYATGDQVSLFPIYSDAVNYVSNNEKNLSDAYNEYAIWRYFTGNRSIPNQYFDESSYYCEASTISDFESSFTLPGNKGATQFINLPSEDIGIMLSTEQSNDINFLLIAIDSTNQVDLIPLANDENTTPINLLADNTNILIANSNYNNPDPIDIYYTLSIDDSNLIGDTNLDGSVDVLDVVYIVNTILSDSYNAYGDMNLDGELNVVDIVLLMDIILSL